MMKRESIFLIVVLFCLFSCSSTEIVKKLESLYRSEDYFEFNRVLQQNKEQLPQHEQLYFQSLSLKLLNKPAESNQMIEEVIAKYADRFPDTVLTQIYETKASNARNLFEYKIASQALNTILTSHPTVFSKTHLNDIKDDSVMYQILNDCKKQTIVVLNDCKVSLMRDKAGLMNLTVKGSDKDSCLFIFDTGANLSTITESMALKLNLKIFEQKIKVNGMGGETMAKIGDCPVLKIGSATLYHVIFLIFPDSALYFKQVDYQINGIVGFPVMNALKQITITDRDFYIYKQEASRNFQNLLLNGLQPMIEVDYRGAKLPFNFDSGANTTDLFVAFYDKFKNDSTLKLKDTTVSIGGATGMNKFDVKQIASVQLTTANKLFKLRNIHLHISNKILPASSHSYGNIGQDFIHNYKSMTMNFDKMFIDFE